MSIWPEHPEGFAPSLKDTQAAHERLLQGPPEMIPASILVGVAGGVEHSFPEARWLHYPGVGSPEHLLIWTNCMSVVIQYHSIDYMQRQDR